MGARGKSLFGMPRGAAMIAHPLKSIARMSDTEWDRAFPGEETCIEWLVDARWPQDVCCPRCGSDMVFPASLREYRWRCFGCAPDLGHPFDHRTGTIFQDSLFSLRIWLKALHHELTGKGPSYDVGEQRMRRHLRAHDFRHMVGEPGPAPFRMRESPDAQTLFAPEEQSCPEPASLTVLSR